MEYAVIDAGTNEVMLWTDTLKGAIKWVKAQPVLDREAFVVMASLPKDVRDWHSI